MPFTPFHMGPGAAIKLLSGSYFSLMVFGFAQGLIDLEPLIRILNGDSVLHGFTHTYVGAMVVGTAALLIGKPVCAWMIKMWNNFVTSCYSSWLVIKGDINWFAASTGAFIGTFSHVLLDSLMHADMHPWWPFTYANEMLGIIPVAGLYFVCMLLGIVAILVMGAWFLWNKWSIDIE